MGAKQFAKSALLKNGFLVQRIPKIRFSQVYYLHIGKTAGTQIKQLSDQINARQRDEVITSMPHEILLKHLPEESPYFFSIRDPIARFRSGFYDRKRMGRPRYSVAWTPDEEKVFNDFPHANDLAEALFRGDELGARAFMAMESLQHVSSHQVNWFIGEPHFLDTRPPVHIVRQELFERDFAVLIRKLDLPLDLEELNVIEDAKTGHIYDYVDVPELSLLARENLRVWFARDFEFYKLCTEWCESS